MNTCKTTGQRRAHNKRGERRGRRRPESFIPHFGNIVGEILNAPLSEVLSDQPKQFTRPASNIKEGENSIIIELAIPGFSKGDLNIAVDKDLLTISADKEENAEVKFKLREFNYSKFKRSFRLSEKIDLEAITAEFKNGILIITLSKKAVEPAKTIEIK